MVTHHLQAQFVEVVNRWERRLRLQQSVEWLPRGLIGAMSFAVALAIFSRTRPGISDGQVILMAGIAVAVVALVILGVIWLKPTPVIQSAQRFDRSFGLQERVSTAIELIEGKIRADTGLTDRQVDDAWNVARGVRYDEHLPLGVNRRDLTTLAVLLVGFIVIMLVFTPALADPSAQVQQRAAIAAAEDDLKDIIEEIATDSTLQEEEREDLLEALQTNLETLQEEDITTEEAFATLNEAESTLREQSETLQEQLQMQQNALATAAEAMQQTAPEQPPGQSAEQALQALMDSLNNMTPEQQSQAADALEQAAQALEQTAPAAAQALREAAEALRQGDTAKAQEALQSAMQQMQQAQQNAQQQNQTAQQLQQAAQQAQQAGQQVAGQQPNQQGQQGQQGQQNQPGQQGQEGQEGQQGAQGQNGQQPGEGDQPGDGDQPGQGNQPGQQGQPGQQADGQPQGSQSGTGSGAGDAAGDLTQAVPGDRPDSNPNASRDNNPDGGGVGEYDPVFAPNNIGGEGGDELRLQADPDETPLQEGEFSSNPDGQVTVPYDQVFSSYADAASRALDSDYIPLGLRDVIRDYFTSLDPAPPAPQP